MGLKGKNHLKKRFIYLFLYSVHDCFGFMYVMYTTFVLDA